MSENKTQPELGVPNTLGPINLVSQDTTPWCLPCDQPHLEWACPTQDPQAQESQDSPQDINMVGDFDHIYHNNQKAFHITLDQIQKTKEKSIDTRTARMKK